MADEKTQRAAPFGSDPSDPVPEGIRSPGRPSYKRKKASQRGLPFYKGMEREQQLNHLADMYWHHERGEFEAQQLMLEHARGKGEVLIEARRILGGRKKWSEWKKTHGIKPKNKRSLSDYRRVARHWDDPKMVELRESGGGPKSIREFIAVLRGIVGDEETNKPNLSDSDAEAEMVIQELRRWFGEHLKKLNKVELNSLYTDALGDIAIVGREFFKQWGGIPHAEEHTWDALYGKLRELIEPEPGLTEKEERRELEEWHELVRTKIVPAMERSDGWKRLLSRKKAQAESPA